MQIKVKPGKPTEPGDYVCKRKKSHRLELVRIWTSTIGLVIGSWAFTMPLNSLEDDALFSERIDISVEE